MYGYEEYFDLSPEHVLQKVTQEQIFSIFFSEIITDCKIYTNPLREDKNPGCYFEYYNDALLFIDFRDKRCTHRSCFRMVMDKYKTNLRGALRFICNHFGLSYSSTDYQEVKIAVDYEKSIKDPLIINYKNKQFTKQDKKFWSQYLIYPEHLIEDNVDSVSSYSYRNKIVDIYGLCYAYNFPNGKVKIYQPYADPKFKWFTNCTNDDVGNIQNISDRSTSSLVITKAYKDNRVIRNADLKECVWFQNEGQVPSDKINIDLITRFPHIYFFFDNDLAGIEAADKLVTIYNNYKQGCASAIHLPENCPWKDPSDFQKKEGREDLIKFMKEKNLYGKI